MSATPMPYEASKPEARGTHGAAPRRRTTAWDALDGAQKPIDAFCCLADSGARANRTSGLPGIMEGQWALEA